MPHDPGQDLGRLEGFLAESCPALGLDAAQVPVDVVLGLASEVARVVQRPGVPVVAYALGVAVGRGLDRDAALATLTDQLAAYEQEHGENPQRRPH